MSAIDHSISITPEQPNKDLNYQVKDGKLHIAGKACVVKQGDKIITNPEQLQKLADVFNDTLSAKAKIGKNEVWSINPNRVQVLNRSFFNAHTEKIGKGVHAVKFKADMASDAPGVLQNLLRDFGVLAQDVEKAAHPIVHPQSSGPLPAAPQARERESPMHLDEGGDLKPPALANRGIPAQRKSMREVEDEDESIGIEIHPEESHESEAMPESVRRPADRTDEALDEPAKASETLVDDDDSGEYESFREDDVHIQPEVLTAPPSLVTPKSELDKLRDTYNELLSAAKEVPQSKRLPNVIAGVEAHVNHSKVEDRKKILEQSITTLRREIEADKADKKLPIALEEARTNYKDAMNLISLTLDHLNLQLKADKYKSNNPEIIHEKTQMQDRKDIIEGTLEKAQKELERLKADGHIDTQKEVDLLKYITTSLKDLYR